MPDKTTDTYGPPQVTDKRIPPPGILPKNVQGWVIGGLAAIMVVAIWLPGSKTPKDKPPAPPVTNTVIDPNALRIQEYKKRLEEETRKLETEQAELARREQAFEGSSAGPSVTNLRSVPADYSGDFPRSEENGVRAEKEKRDYESLFASNIALTFRKEPAPPTKQPPAQGTDEWGKMLSFYSALASIQNTNSHMTPSMPSVPTAPPVGPSGLPPVPDSSAGMPDAEKRAEKALRQKPNARGAEGKEYRLMEGTIIETVLTNRLDGAYSGPTNCMVTTNVYSHDGQRLLIPQGSRMLGEVRKVDSFGQQRLAVTFHRLIMPDHYSVDLDKYQGLDQIGETGLQDQVNHHYLQVFGVSLAIGAIAGLGESQSRTGLVQSGTDAYEQGVATSLSQSSLRILDRYLNVLPTFTIREGHRIKIYLAEDLWLPAYDQHQISND
jgi:type IV secretion system protein VirB10